MNNKLQLPKGCKVLNVEEMMKNESGWYMNFKTGEYYVTYNDINNAVNWVTSMMKKMGLPKDSADNIVKEEKDNSNNDGGFGIRINNEGFKLFKLDEEALKLANSNSIIF